MVGGRCGPRCDHKSAHRQRSRPDHFEGTRYHGKDEDEDITSATTGTAPSCSGLCNAPFGSDMVGPQATVDIDVRASRHALALVGPEVLCRAPASDVALTNHCPAKPSGAATQTATSNAAGTSPSSISCSICVRGSRQSPKSRKDHSVRMLVAVCDGMASAPIRARSAC
jgi:hypothetical protein